MASPPPNSKRRARLGRMIARQCVSHTLALFLYVFQILLVALAVLIGYMLLRDDIPVPDFLRGRIAQELERIGLEASFETAQFDPTGRIFVTGLRLRPEGFQGSVLEAERVFVQLDRIKLLAGKPGIDLLELEKARVLCPPAISPSGVSETIMEVSTTRIRHNHGLWTVDGLVGRIGPARVTARGRYFAELQEDRPPPDVQQLVGLYAKNAPRFVLAREWLSRIVDPALDISFDGTGQSVDASLQLSAIEGAHPQYGEVHDLLISTSLSLAEGELRLPLRGKASARRLAREDMGSVDSVRVSAEWVRKPDSDNPWPARLEISTGRIKHTKVTLDGARATLFPADFPRVVAHAWLPLEDENLALQIEGNAEARSGMAEIEGRFGRQWLETGSRILGRDITYYATIDEPPHFTATAEIGPGLQWRRVDFSLLSGPITARGVQLDRVRVHGSATTDHVKLHHLEISRDDEYAIGTYEDQLATRENRIRLRGSMRPLSISPWFSAWWERFWCDYGFSDAAPHFEVDVHGNWLEGHKTRVSGETYGEAITIRGHSFNSVDSRFFIRPNYYDLYDAHLRRVEGGIAGEVQLQFRPGDRNPVRQQWEFESTADLVALADIFGPGGKALFEPYSYRTPPKVAGEGIIEQENGVYDTDIELEIATPHPFRYYDFPLESLETSVNIRNRHVELPEFTATYAGGRVTGNAVVDDGTLTVDAALKDADYDLAVETFGAFLDRKSPEEKSEEQSPPTEDGLGSREVGGRLDIELEATGPLTEYQAYQGSGEARIREGDLAKINLFGPLSQVLDSLGIKLGTLRLNEAVGQFEVRKDQLVFPSIRITGSTGALETTGTYSLADGSVDFKARLFPLRESSGAFTQVFGLLLEPVSNLLEMRLTGTLEEPRWSFTRDPISIVRELMKKKEEQEEVPEPPLEAAPPESGESQPDEEPDATEPQT